MARYTGPKDRLSRREGFDLFGKGSKLTRLTVPPGFHGPKGIGKVSQYGQQLREKQKIKRLYGIYEKQFRRYVTQAVKSKGNTGNRLLSLLERRLDNTVYRLGFAPTRPAARQYVSHRHILVNDKKVNIPSYQVKNGDTVSLTSTAAEIPAVQKRLNEDLKLPKWLKRKAIIGKVVGIPLADDVPEPISIQDIIEFYSR
ncbi:30S ribosomal protein S4 [Candidatus Woesebacteria bacterium RBG_16_34_12]|uniref:Small ribosomal subunit protein uS4 n=1 Tax=Candidatus Woesebacteria bacterium RBG_16_34_12 TaxID=1802480 RepID=A0A1F7X9F4_9BACT|nr:MAG: 30S ribosomal protein S4 [Candidatus Woesebacteria bacterium RBG_16_34_12]